MSALAGYLYRALAPYKGITATDANIAVQPAKVLPATGAQTIFTVAGSVAILDLVGVVSTAFSITAVNISLGVTGVPAALAANPAAAFASTAIGSVITLPALLGGQLPAAVAAKGSANAFEQFVAKATNIIVTTDATNTGAVTWICAWAPLSRKIPGSVTAP